MNKYEFGSYKGSKVTKTLKTGDSVETTSKEIFTNYEELPEDAKKLLHYLINSYKRLIPTKGLYAPLYMSAGTMELRTGIPYARISELLDIFQNSQILNMTWMITPDNRKRKIIHMNIISVIEILGSFIPKDTPCLKSKEELFV